MRVLIKFRKNNLGQDYLKHVFIQIFNFQLKVMKLYHHAPI